MGAVAFVAFAGFYAASCKEPVVVLRGRSVLDSNVSARRMGIVPGIASSEARYATRGAPVRFEEYREDEYAERAKQWLDVCCEYTTVIEPLQPHSAYLDLRALPAPHEVAEQLAADLFHAVRLCPTVGLAKNKLIARVAGRALFPCEEAAFFSGLSIDSLWRVPIEHRRRLRFLGYRTIGEVARLPDSLLRSQFGDQGTAILRWAMGIDDSPVLALYPPEEVSAKFYFPQPARNDAEIEAAIQRLSVELSAKLESRDAQARKVQLTAFFERRESHHSRVFNRPMRGAGPLSTGIRLTLRQCEIAEDVFALHVCLQHEPAADLQAGFDDNPAQPVIDPALARLKDTFGSQAVVSAGDVATPRRRLLLRAYEGGS